MGYGKRRGRQTKHAKWLLKQAKIWGKPKPDVSAMRLIVKCDECSGAGVVSCDPGVVAEAQTAAARRAAPVVGIVGGGIGGLALALALQQRGMRAVVYEKDSSFNMRSQGYGLTMQQGGAALKQLGLDMDSESISSTAHFSFTPEGKVIGCYGRRLRAQQAKKPTTWTPETPGYELAIDSLLAGTPTPEKVDKDTASKHGRKSNKKRKQHKGNQNRHIPRQRLREMLYEALLPGSVRWGHKLTRYAEHADGVTLTLARGGVTSSARVAVLVGADGIFSRVRREKLGEGMDTLRYLDLMVVLGITTCDHPGYGETVCQTLDGDTRIFTMPFTSAAGVGCGRSGVPPGCTMWQLSFPAEEEEARRIARTPQTLKTEALRRCGNWHSPIPQLLGSTDFSLVTGYPVFDRPLLSVSQCRGPAHSRVTLLGDAAHPMSPFKGQGANQALLDAIDLARALFRSEVGSCARAAWEAGRATERSTELRELVEAASFRAHSTTGTRTRFEPIWQRQRDSDPAHSNHGDVWSGRGSLSTAEALAMYERGMIERSSKKVRHSAEAALVLHRTEAMRSCAGQTRASAALAALRGEDPMALRHSGHM